MRLPTPPSARLPRPFGYSFVDDRSTGYRAHERVGVHVFAPTFVDDPFRLDELAFVFETQARALVGVTSTGLLTTLGVERAPSLRWITEHRPAMPLDELLARHGSPGWSGSLFIAHEVLRGLGAIHARTNAFGEPLFHGDVSTRAVLVDADGHARLDPLAGFRWGYAATDDLPPPSARFQHVSPARICGDPPVVADEIFAVGSVLGALLIGGPVFRGINETATLRQIMEADTSRFEGIAKGLPTPIVDLVRTALQRRPERRFPSVQAFAQALQTAAARLSIPLTPVPLPASPPSVLSVAAP